MGSTRKPCGVNENSIDIFQQTVSEGDIDWLLCVELNSSEPFRKWIGSILFHGVSDFEHIRAWRSVSNYLGESDLIWLVEHPNRGRLMALIENKINAIAQPDQCNRYVQRGEGYVNEGLAQSYSLALISPESYRSFDDQHYPIRITYEEIVNWLSKVNNERSQYLRSLYEAGINKRNCTTPIDEEMSLFRENIWRLAMTEFPNLNIPDPRTTGGNEYWIFMRHVGYTLIYKTYKKHFKYTKSIVDLELAGRGDEVDKIKDQFRSELENSNISVVKTGKSASFRLEVPLIEPPEYEEQKVRQALRAATQLQEWWGSTIKLHGPYCSII